MSTKLASFIFVLGPVYTTACVKAIVIFYYLLVSLLMLPEEMLKDRSVLFMDSLHLVDVLSHLLHSNQGLGQMLKQSFIRT